jgi:hypothetical protein
MGYCTNYKLSIHQFDCDIDKQDIIQEKIDSLLKQEYDYLSDAYFDKYGSGQVKGYSHEEEMREISGRFPSVVFLLEGDGEESPDTWKKYFKNGKMQECQAIITFDEYDEDKLA